MRQREDMGKRVWGRVREGERNGEREGEREGEGG